MSKKVKEQEENHIKTLENIITKIKASKSIALSDIKDKRATESIESVPIEIEASQSNNSIKNE